MFEFEFFFLFSQRKILCLKMSKFQQKIEKVRTTLAHLLCNTLILYNYLFIYVLIYVYIRTLIFWKSYWNRQIIIIMYLIFLKNTNRARKRKFQTTQTYIHALNNKISILKHHRFAMFFPLWWWLWKIQRFNNWYFKYMSLQILKNTTIYII